MIDIDINRLAAAACGSTAAIRARVRMQPAGGPGDKVFPPTYAVKSGTRYAFEERRIEGETVQCVLLDSVASQANRMEEALRRAWERGRLDLPVILVDFSDLEGLQDLGRITTLDAPHRIADALMRDSLLDGELFRFTAAGQALDHARVDNAAPLYACCPTALLFGVWDSTGPRGGLGTKFPRALVSEVVGVRAVAGVKTSSRLDPAGIQVNAGTLYTARDEREMWTLDEAESAKGQKYGKTKKESGKPSAANHGNVAPSLDQDAGGVTMDYALQTTVLSLTALRRLGFPTLPDGTPVARDRREAVERAAHTVLAALGLAAIAEGWEQGHFYRSRCHLVPIPEHGGLELELVERDGSEGGRFSITPGAAARLLREAVDAAAEQGLTWATEEVVLSPAPKLQALIRKSRELVAVGEGKEAAEA